ncbi:MAG: carboxypeptidase-like regulatory domain-containing protein [Myxococcota bacterium]
MKSFLPAMTLLLSIPGCSADVAIAVRGEDVADGDEELDASAPTEPEPAVIRVDAFPSDALLGPELDDGFRALPKTSPRFRVDGTRDVDIGTLELDTPLRFTGRIEGFRLNPQVTSVLPGSLVPAPATVRLSLPDTVQDYVVSTNEAGEFAAWVGPQATYTLSVRSEDPSFPNFEDVLRIDDAARDIELNLPLGVPVFGRVSTAVGPILGAEVHLVDAEGRTSAVATTDEDGWYTIRTPPGTFAVVCDGGNPLRRPQITHPDIVVDDEMGAFVDFDYIDTDRSLVAGRVITEEDVDLGGAEVRFRSENLIGYDGVDAVWTFTARLQQGESYLAQVLPGSYDIEIVPPQRPTDALADPFGQAAAPDVSPEQLRDVIVVDDEITLPDIELLASALVLGQVVDAEGLAVEATRIECTEIGFGQRQWSVLTDVFGSFQIRLPQIPMGCNVIPTGASGLANLTFGFVPGEREGPTVVLDEGVAVSGRVLGPDGRPESFATVRLRRDGDTELLGSGLTDEDGRYSVRITP